MLNEYYNNLLDTDLKELDILEKFLKKNDFKYERIDKWIKKGDDREFHQLVVEENNGIWDVICHPGSYGWREGLLEICGKYVDADYDVEGYLEAEDIIMRIFEERSGLKR